MVLDTFAGSGSIGIACEKLGIDYKLIEKNKDFCEISNLRIKYWSEKFKNEVHKSNISTDADFVDESQLRLFEG
jgi:DNA modification methylase